MNNTISNTIVYVLINVLSIGYASCQSNKYIIRVNYISDNYKLFRPIEINAVRNTRLFNNIIDKSVITIYDSFQNLNIDLFISRLTKDSALKEKPIADWRYYIVIRGSNRHRRRFKISYSLDGSVYWKGKYYHVASDLLRYILPQ